jgi:probable F420-dependent oxidoreductase
MKFGLSVAFSDPSHIGAMAAAADRAGFDCVALSDHVVHPKRIRTPYPYTDDGSTRWPPFTDWLDPWVAISAMAAVTERIRFFTSVYVLPMRSPFLVAKTVSSAAVLSGGRVALGVGAGWMRDEFDLMEQAFDARGRRMDEMIDVLRRIWSGGWVEHHGDHYDFDPLEMSPAPVDPIPIYVGGFSPPAIRRAATRRGWGDRFWGGCWLGARAGGMASCGEWLVWGATLVWLAWRLGIRDSGETVLLRFISPQDAIPPARWDIEVGRVTRSAR